MKLTLQMHGCCQKASRSGTKDFIAYSTIKNLELHVVLVPLASRGPWEWCWAAQVDVTHTAWTREPREPKSFLMGNKPAWLLSWRETAFVIRDTKQPNFKGETLYLSRVSLNTHLWKDSLKQRPLLTRSAEDPQRIVTKTGFRFFPSSVCFWLHGLFKSFWWMGTFFKNANALTQVLVKSITPRSY